MSVPRRLQVVSVQWTTVALSWGVWNAVKNGFCGEAQLLVESGTRAKHRKKNGENRRECIVVYCEVPGRLFDAGNVVRRCAFCFLVIDG